MPTWALNAWEATQERLRRLEQRERRRRRGEGFRGQYEFKVSPTCPPSTSIHVRGGRAWSPTDGTYPGRGWTVPSATYDLTDPDDTWAIAYVWTNANYYLGTVVCLSGGMNPDYIASGDPPLVWFTTQPAELERQTAAEAEDDCIDIMWDAINRPWQGNIPLCMMVLRNNGNIVDPMEIMAIDAANRGRSYIWQDTRPRGLWVVGSI